MDDRSLLLLLGLLLFLLHTFTNGQYGFHRDELLTLDNARHLAWGYVVYPPLTPFLARVELTLFGNSLIGYRFFAALAESVVVVLTGLAVRNLGGKRQTQLLAAVAAGIGGLPMASGTFFSYEALDYMWWSVAAFCVLLLLRTGNPRWWLGVGAAVGLGLMTKYTMAFLALGILGGVLLTPGRRYLAGRWFWCGTLLAILIVLPNFVWQLRHGFVFFKFIHSIHARDIGFGWTDHFLIEQLWKCTCAAAVPFWCAGLWYLFADARGRRYRMLGWMYVIPLILLFLARGRDYYLAPAYPILIAAGAVCWEQWLSNRSAATARTVRRIAWPVLAVNGVMSVAVTLPIAPLNSAWWHAASAANSTFRYEIGYPDLVKTIAGIRSSLPATDRATLGILTADDGETGAVDLYGPAWRLPHAISGMNSSWDRGYGDPPPQTVIAVGIPRDFLDRSFASCTVAGHATNAYGIVNHAIGQNTEIDVCRNLRIPWPEFWRHFQSYG